MVVVVKPADDGSYFVDTITKKGQLVKFAPACQPYPGLELRIDPCVTLIRWLWLLFKSLLKLHQLNSASSPMPGANWELQKQWDVRLESQKTYRVNTEKDMSILHWYSARLTCPFQCWLCRSFETQVSHLIVSVFLNFSLAWASWQSWVMKMSKRPGGPGQFRHRRNVTGKSRAKKTSWGP